MLHVALRVIALVLLANGCFAAPINATLPVSASWTAVCANVVNHTCIQVNPHGITVGCVQVHDLVMSSHASFASALSVPCRAAFMRYMCAFFAPPCDFPDSFPPTEIAAELTNTSICASPLDQGWLSVYKAASGTTALPFGYNFSTGFPSEANPNIVYKITTSSAASSIPVPQCVSAFNDSTSVCSKFVTYPYYLGGMSSTAVQVGTVKQLTATVLSTPKPCVESYLRLMCQTFFPRCYYALRTNGQVYTTPNVPDANGLPSVFPSFPSLETCNDARREECRGSSGLFIQENLPPTIPFRDCVTNFTAQRFCDADFSQPRYVAQNASGWIIRSRFNTVISAVRANNVTSGPTAEELEALIPQCPAPLVKPNGGGATIENGACALPCPPFLRTQDEYKQGDKVLLGFAWVSWVLITLLMGTFYAFRKTRKKPFPMYFSTCIFMTTTGLCFTVGVNNSKNDGFGKFFESACKDNSQINPEGWCLFQALCMLYGGFGACCWWCIQAVDLYTQIWWNAAKWPKDRQRKVTIVYMIWGWGYPLLNLIIAGGLGDLGSGNNSIPYCLITDSDVAWGVFYAPIGVMAVIGAACMCMIIYAILKSSASSGAHKKKGGWLIYLRPVLFVTLFLGLWSFVFAFRFSEYFNETRYTDEGRAYVQCLLRNTARDMVLGINPPTSCEQFRPVPDLGMWYGILVIIGGVGIWSFMLYNTNENFVMWYHLLTCKSYNFSTTSGPSEDSTSRGSKKTASKRNVNSGSSRNLKTSTSGSVEDNATGAGEGTLRYGAPPPVPDQSQSNDVLMTQPSAL